MTPSNETASPVYMEQIRVRGIVQGVGFRPTVFRLAQEQSLDGEVFNDGEGVCIRIAGQRHIIDIFLASLLQQTPPLARIDSILREPFDGRLEQGFRIISSGKGEARTAITPDAATCAQCLSEVFDSSDRRYRYPFTNCTYCGPRLSIVRAIPYDRKNTSMATFPMCSECHREYHNVDDRRFHAQPNACPVCGPHLWMKRTVRNTMTTDMPVVSDDVELVSHLLKKGHILAIKGLGGFQLACDASNQGVVACLRTRKHRYEKPFALMATNTSMIANYCQPTRAEQALLESPESPIVILSANGPEKLANSVAPGQHTYGFMLPYTPLHHLLMSHLDRPIVLTSGNLSDEPQCIDNHDAQERLGKIADFLLLHNRDIVNRVDDSVARVVAGKPRLLRRARGYAPAPLTLPRGFDKTHQILALGGQLKNTCCLLRDGEAILSQHLGDLENSLAYVAYQNTLDLFLGLFDHNPTVLAVDLHPEYFSTKLGKEWATSSHLALVEVQHHHAHIAACLAENDVPLNAPPVLGIALDGLGFGPDETLWGGEFLLADYQSYRRLAMFEPVPMPGGVKAISEPWRMAYAYLQQNFDWVELHKRYAHTKFFQSLQDKPLKNLKIMIDKGLYSPQTSSCGRLFDAVSAVVSYFQQEVSYEGQAAIELEAAVDLETLRQDDTSYTFDLGKENAGEVAYIGTQPMWQALLRDISQDTPAGVISGRFHKGLANAIVGMVEQLTERYRDPWQGRVALSGGVFQNAILASEVATNLEALGLEVFSHAHVPANDGGLSLGQAVIAAARELKP